MTGGRGNTLLPRHRAFYLLLGLFFPAACWGETLHIVGEGDSLTRIAQQYYADPSQWNKICKANAALLQGVDYLEIGWELRIPDVPSSEALDCDCELAPGAPAMELEVSAEQVDSVLQNAIELNLQAAEQRNEWLHTAWLIRRAQEMLSGGYHATALRFAERAELQARAALAQAEQQADIKPRLDLPTDNTAE